LNKVIARLMTTKHWFALMGTLILPVLFGCAQVEVPPTAVAPPPPPDLPAVAAPPPLAPAAGEVVTLAQSGSSQDVILAYIQNSPTAFNLSADQIVYLRDIGVSSVAITAMLNRDNALHTQTQTYVYNQVAYPPTIAPPAPLPETAPAAPVTETAPPTPVTQAAPPPTEAPAPVYVSSPPPDVTYFYSDLSPYGSWVQLDGVGWCWQPRVVVVNHGWQPYCDGGHWVWTDAGWFWASDYSWGWAPFHYGRWYLHDRCGWVWLPDRTWGPAWVTWRVAGDQCGWAPLPPHAVFDARLGWAFNGVHVGVNFDFGLHANHFTFVALHDFNAYDLGHRRLPPTQVTQVYNHTTIVNNYVVNNNVVVNQGVKVENIAAATHSQIHKVTIRDVPSDSIRTLPAHGSKANPSVVYRSELKAPPATSPGHMTAQKVDDRHPVIQHQLVAPTRATPQLRSPGNHHAPTPAPQWTTQTPPNAPSRTPSPAPNYSSSKGYQTTTPTPPHAQAAPQTASTPVHAPDQPAHSTVAPATQRSATAPSVAAYSSPKMHETTVPTPPRTQAAPQTGAPAYGPDQSTHSAMTPAAQRSATAPTAASHASVAANPAWANHPNQQSMSPSRTTSDYQPHSASPGDSHVVSPASAAQNHNSHVYPPKSAQQAAEAYALPPLNPHQ
jgi:hypothetical protein